MKVNKIALPIVFLLTTLVQGKHLYISDQEHIQSLAFTGPKPIFHKPFYVARVNSDESGVYLRLANGPIILENCALVTNLRILLDDFKSYPILPSPEFHPLGNCKPFSTIYMKAISTKIDHFPNVIFLIAESEAYTDTMTNIVILNEQNTGPLQQVFDIGGTEFVVLNYFDFKAFLFIILSIAVLILGLEIMDFTEKLRRRYTSRWNGVISDI